MAKIDGQLYNAQLEHLDETQSPESAGRVAYNKDCETATLDTGDRVVQVQDQRHDPVGTIKMWATDTAPEFHVICNGQALSRIQHAELFSVLGVMYGVGDNINTFNVPDYRGYFLRATDAGRGVYINAVSRDARPDGALGDVVGTTQNDQFKSHTHDNEVYAVADSAGPYISSAATPAGTPSIYVSGATGQDETRPKNININYIIKVK